MKAGRTIIDIGPDLHRAIPSILDELEQRMLSNVQKLHPGSLEVIKK